MSARAIPEVIKERTIMVSNKRQSKGVIAALSSAVFLGLSPVFARMAILGGFSPLAVVALRTGLATLLIFVGIVIFRRQFLYIFPVGLAGCFLAGVINGMGSILYFLALGQLPASVGQLLYALYPLFVAVFSFLDKQPVSKLTILRVLIAAVAVFLLTNTNEVASSTSAVLMMLG